MIFSTLSPTLSTHRGRGDHQGPQGAPLSSESPFWHYNVSQKAIAALLRREMFPRRYWRSARNMILCTGAHYQQAQPQFARETEGKASAKLFQERTLNEIVNHVCYDLRLTLGCILDQPALCEMWKYMETTSKLAISPLLLPDGSHYSYLQIEGTSPGYVNAKFGQAEYGGPRPVPSYWASGGCSVAACGQSPQGA